MNRSPELQAALDAAAEAADIARSFYRHNLQVRIKADKSPVTEADLQCELAIKRVIESRFTGHGFFGEETGLHGADADKIWIVDPIDGTKAFIREYPFFSTQIGMMQGGDFVLGVSSAPLYGELAHAERGGGAYLNDRPIEVSAVTTLDAATLSVGNMNSLATGPQWVKYGKMIAGLARIRGYGDFLHYHLLAAGKIDAVIETDVVIYDVAACVAIVQEAGGRCTQLDGQRLTLRSTTILATNGYLHEPVLAALA